MELIKKNQLNNVLTHRSEPCISIFMHTNIAGKEVLENQDKTKLKSKWDQCSRALKEKGFTSESIKKIGKPIQEVLENDSFWKHQSHGLALFAAENFFEKFRLPTKFEDYTHISNHFYVRPLADALSANHKFYVLALQLEEVKLYEATEFSFSEVNVKNHVPANINDVVGYDYEEKHLQVRNQQQNDAGGSMFHGQGAGNREEKEEVFRFFNAVDKGIVKVLQDENAPLVVYCQDYLFPIYKEANSYQNLYEKPVKGNPNDVNINGLHEKAVDLLEDYFKSDKREKLEQYEEAKPEMKTDVVHDILPFAFEGKIDTLFLENRADLWGNFEENQQKVEIHKERNDESLSLMNLAAMQVLKNDGTVYLMNSAFMPSKGTKINALLRYS